MPNPTEIEQIPTENDTLCQGDIFKNLKYNYIVSEGDDLAEVEECIFPHAIIISQACDTISVSELFMTKNGSKNKYMPTILLCPIYYDSEIRCGNHLSEVSTFYGINLTGDNIYNSKEYEVIKSKMHCRFFRLNLTKDNKPFLSNSIIDFKHCISIPVEVLLKQRYNRIARVDNCVAEEVTQRFCSYLSRMAIP